MANNERFRNHLGNCTGGRRRSPSSVLDDERVRYGCSETVLLLVRRVFAAARCLAPRRGRGITGAYLHDRGRTAPALVGVRPWVRLRNRTSSFSPETAEPR